MQTFPSFQETKKHYRYITVETAICNNCSIVTRYILNVGGEVLHLQHVPFVGRGISRSLQGDLKGDSEGGFKRGLNSTQIKYIQSLQMQVLIKLINAWAVYIQGVSSLWARFNL